MYLPVKRKLSKEEALCKTNLACSSSPPHACAKPSTLLNSSIIISISIFKVKRNNPRL